MTGRNSAVSSASPPKPPSKSRRNAPHPTTRKRPWETRRPFGRESRAFFVSGWRCRDRPKANLRKFRGYSSDCQNQKYEAISEGFVADETVAREPVSESEIPCYQGKEQGISRKPLEFQFSCRGKQQDFNRME